MVTIFLNLKGIKIKVTIFHASKVSNFSYNEIDSESYWSCNVIFMALKS